MASKAVRHVTDTPAANYESPDWLPDGDYTVGTGALAGGDRCNPRPWMWHFDGGTAGMQLIDDRASSRIAGRP
jgi:hypothetical protein